jgi:hypothetical protein
MYEFFDRNLGFAEEGRMKRDEPGKTGWSGERRESDQHDVIVRSTW